MTLIDKIKAEKPSSIHDVIPTEFFTKYDSYEYVWSGNCFEWYYAISKVLQPKTFMEIGVRYGFSFLPTIIASSVIEEALGWDLETYGDNQIARTNISKYYNGPCKWNIEHVDSQKEKDLPEFFDLVSIDGCHEYGCKIHDLEMAMRNSRYTVLDDYDYIPAVRKSIDDFIRDNKDNIEEYHYFPSFRGSMLIKFKCT